MSKHLASLLGDDALSPDESAAMEADRKSGPETAALAAEEAPEPAPEPVAPVEPPAEPAAPEAPEAPETAEGDEPAADPPAESGNKDRDLRLAAERRAKAAEKVAREAEQKLERFNGRMDVLQQLAQPRPQEAAPAEPAPIEVPDFDADPAGHLKAVVEQIRADLGGFGKDFKALQEAQTVQNNIEALVRHGIAHEEAYAQDHPDYRQAAMHLYNVRSKQLEVMKVGRNRQERDAIIRNEYAQMTAAAIQNGASVADAIYQMAGAMGYSAQAEAAPATVAVTAPASPPAPVAPTAAEQLQRVTKGQEVSQSLSSAPGGAQPKTMTALDLANMSDEAFDDYCAKHPNWQKVMEGLPKGT